MQINSRKRRTRRTGCSWLAVMSVPVGQELSLNDLVTEDPMSSPGLTSSNPQPGAQLGASPTSAIGICPRGARASSNHSRCEIVKHKKAVANPWGLSSNL